MKFVSLVVALSCAFAVVQAGCGGGEISGSEADDLKLALNDVSSAPLSGDTLTYCNGNMCVACVNNVHTKSNLRNRCSQAAGAIQPDVGAGSSGQCNYPGLKGLSSVSYWQSRALARIHKEFASK
ncbi:hypothetical protein BGZ68_001073 [Mortierella alpina]|nr:hypothetical protein BGZ68_001073 [Mortierella alpina]